LNGERSGSKRGFDFLRARTAEQFESAWAVRIARPDQLRGDNAAVLAGACVVFPSGQSAELHCALSGDVQGAANGSEGLAGFSQAAGLLAFLIVAWSHCVVHIHMKNCGCQ
jgi:hypothetical protein